MTSAQTAKVARQQPLFRHYTQLVLVPAQAQAPQLVPRLARQLSVARIPLPYLIQLTALLRHPLPAPAPAPLLLRLL